MSILNISRLIRANKSIFSNKSIFILFAKTKIANIKKKPLVVTKNAKFIKT